MIASGLRQAPCPRDGQCGTDAEPACSVVRGHHDAPACTFLRVCPDHERQRSERRMKLLLDRGIKRIQVDMRNDTHLRSIVSRQRVIFDPSGWVSSAQRLGKIFIAPPRITVLSRKCERTSLGINDLVAAFRCAAGLCFSSSMEPSNAVNAGTKFSTARNSTASIAPPACAETALPNTKTNASLGSKSRVRSSTERSKSEKLIPRTRYRPRQRRIFPPESVRTGQ